MWKILYRKKKISSAFTISRFRPAPGGVSIGHFRITAGTLGCLVKKNDKLFILSNNHVLANSNEADIGDAILQPAPDDGGQNPQDKIGELSEYIPIQFDEGISLCPFARSLVGVLSGLAAMTGSKTRLKTILKRQAEDNLVDCAIAEPLNHTVQIRSI